MNTVLEDWNRHLEWCLLIPEYEDASRNDKKRLKKKYRKDQEMNASEWRAKNCPNKEPSPMKEDTMYATAFATQATVIDNTPKLPAEKTYFLDRVNSVSYDRKFNELTKQFNIYEDARPKTFKELRERLESGKFTLPKDDENVNRYVSLESLIWRDPSKKADPEGWEKACEKIDELATKTKDIIVAQSLDEGLKALEKLETEKFH